MGSISRIFVILISISLLYISDALASVSNGEEYVATLQEFIKTPDSNRPKQARLAAELEEFNLSQMNQGLSVSDRIALAQTVDRILARRALTNRQRIFGVRAAEGLLPQGLRVGATGAPVQAALIKRLRGIVAAPPPGRYGTTLREQSITSIHNMGAVTLHSAQTYIDRLQELSELSPSGKRPLNPIRRESLLQGFDAEETRSLRGSLTQAERQTLANALGSLLNHHNGDVQRFAIQGYAELMSADARGNIQPEQVDLLRRFAHSEKPSAKAKVCAREANAALEKMGEPIDADPYVKKLFEAYNARGTGQYESLIEELRQMDLEGFVRHMSRASRVAKAEEINALLLSAAEPEFHRQVVRAVSVLMQDLEAFARPSEQEQQARNALEAALQTHARSSASEKDLSLAIRQGKLRSEALRALEVLGFQGPPLEVYVNLLEQVPRESTTRRVGLYAQIEKISLSAPQAQEIDRAERFRLAERITSLLRASELPPKTLHLALLVVPQILHPEHVQRHHDDERVTRDNLLTEVRKHTTSQDAYGQNFRNRIPKAAAEALSALGRGSHILEDYVVRLEEMVEANALNRTRLTEELRQTELVHVTNQIEHKDRFALAERVLNVIEHAKTSPTMKELGVRVIPALIGRHHVKKVESAHQSVHSRALSVTEQLMATEKVDGPIHNESIKAHESLGGVPIHDASTYSEAVIEFAELTPPGEPSPDTTRRNKVSLALRGAEPEKLFGELPLGERRDLVELLTEVLGHHNGDVRVYASRGIGGLGAKGGRRRTEVIPDETVEKLQAAASMDAKSDGDRRARAEANEALGKIGLEARLALRSAREFANALDEFSGLEGRVTERTGILRGALSDFSFDLLNRRMSREDRQFAVSTLENVLNDRGLRSREWAIQGLGLLLSTQGYRTSVGDLELVRRVERSLWDLVRRRTAETIVDRLYRARAIDALKAMDQPIIETPEQYVSNLETVVSHWNQGGRSAERSTAENAMDHFNLEMAQPQINPLMRRRLGQTVADLVVDANNRKEGRVRAIHALGHLTEAGRRSGAGIPLEGLNTLRALAASPRGGEISVGLRTAAGEALERMGVNPEGELSPSVRMELFEPRPEIDLGEIIQRLGNNSERLAAARDLEGWSASRLTRQVWRGPHKEFPDVLARHLEDSDIRVREQMIRHLHRWIQENPRTPNWMSQNASLRNAVALNLSNEHGGIRYAAVDLLGNHLPRGRGGDSEDFIHRLNGVIQSAESSEESRLAAARALANSNCESTELVATGLRTALGRANEHHKETYAVLVDSYRRRANHRANSAVYLASRWLVASESPEDLISKITEAIGRSNEPQSIMALEALHWLSSDRITGRPFVQQGQVDFQVPPWLRESNSVTTSLITLLNSDHPQVRQLASNLLTSRGITDNLNIDDAIVDTVIATIASGRRFQREARVAAQILQRVHRSQMNADTYLRLMQIPHGMAEQFHPETVAIVLEQLARVEVVDFTDRTCTRGYFVNIILKYLESPIPRVRQAAAIAAGRVVPRRGTSYGNALAVSINAMARGLRARITHEDSIPDEVAAARESLVDRMKRKEALQARPEPKGRQPREREALVHVVSDLLTENESLQRKAAEALARWSPSRNEGEEVLTRQLEHWRRSGGPDFDRIIAQVILGTLGDSIDVRRATIQALRQLAQRGTRRMDFEPGLQRAWEIQRAIAYSLFDADSDIREEALVLARRRQSSTPASANGGESFEQIIANALRSPNQRNRALQVMESLVSNGQGYRVPPWMAESVDVQGALIDLLLVNERNVRSQTTHQLIYRMAATRRALEAKERRQMGEGAEQRDSRLRELVPPLLNVMQKGSDEAQIAAIDLLSTLGVEDGRILPHLRTIAEADPNPAVRAEAIRGMGFRHLELDLGYGSEGLYDFLDWIWRNFTTNSDPEIRREAAGVIFANTRLLRKLPKKQWRGPREQQTETTTVAQTIMMGLRDIGEHSKYPLSADISEAVRHAWAEVAFGKNVDAAIQTFEASERGRTLPNEAPSGKLGRNDLRAFVEQCRSGGFIK